jgi:hypothetical protein
MRHEHQAGAHAHGVSYLFVATGPVTGKEHGLEHLNNFGRAFATTLAKLGSAARTPAWVWRRHARLPLRLHTVHSVQAARQFGPCHSCIMSGGIQSTPALRRLIHLHHPKKGHQRCPTKNYQHKRRQPCCLSVVWAEQSAIASLSARKAICPETFGLPTFVLLNGSETGAAALDGLDVCRKHISVVGAFAGSDARELIFVLPACGAVAQFRER